jgi:NADH dehydrogenase FAD-containing subunit
MQPRFAISPGHEHKAFIPFSAVFADTPGPPRHQVARARAVSLQPHSLTLDREWQGSRTIPFDFLVVATGTRLAAPGTMPDDDKLPSTRYLQTHQAAIQSAQSIVVIGGGAVGVQMACDLKEIHGASKTITLVHSRDHLMPFYHADLSKLIKARFADLGVNLVTGSRVVIPAGGFPDDPKQPFTIHLQDGRTLPATDLAILATGQTPNNQFLSSLLPPASASSTPLLNPQNGFINVRPTMQFADPAYSHLFAVGDIADTKAHKAAKPGFVQAAVAARNIAAMVEGREAREELTVGVAGIHLTLGLVRCSFFSVLFCSTCLGKGADMTVYQQTRNVIFRNPDTAKGQTEPFVNLKDE